MKLKTQSIAAILMVVAGASNAPASAGGISGGGADYRPVEDGSAWFLGDRVIKVCTQTAPDFVPAGNSIDVGGILTEAFQKWTSYINALAFNQALSPEMRLALKVQIHSPCDGSEDLKVYFGVETPKIDEARKKYVNPLAFVQRTSFDLHTGWSNGFIWIAPSGAVVPSQNFPNWTAPNRLQGVLLHELGHILGCEHVSGTIMQEDIASLLEDSQNADYQKARLTQIDGTKFLGGLINQTYLGSIGVKDETTTPQDTFRLFIGRDPVGKISTKLEVDLAQRKFALELNDDISNEKFPIQFNEPMSGPSFGTGAESGNKIFSIARIMGTTEHLQYFYLPSFAAILFGNVTSSDGKSHMVSFEFNMDALTDQESIGPLSVWYYDLGRRRNLFSMPLPGA